MARRAVARRAAHLAQRRDDVRRLHARVGRDAAVSVGGAVELQRRPCRLDVLPRRALLLRLVEQIAAAPFFLLFHRVVRAAR